MSIAHEDGDSHEASPNGREPPPQPLTNDRLWWRSNIAIESDGLAGELPVQLKQR